MSERGTLTTQLLFWLSIAMLCFAPLMRGGRMSPAIMVLEILGIILLVLALWQPVEKNRITKLAWLFIATSVLIPLLYLIPLPMSVWQSLPGRGLYAETQVLMENNGASIHHPALSLIPYRTVSSLLALLPLLGIFVATLRLPSKKLITLVYVFLGIAAFQASLGLIQYGSGADWTFWWGITVSSDTATGTYPNRDHFAALMELAIPLALGLAAYNVGNPVHIDREEHHHVFNQAIIFFALSVLLILAGIFSRSRAGLLLVILGILFSSFTFSRHMGGREAVGLNSIVISVSISIATSIGLIPVLNRFANDPLEDGRWPIFDATVEGIKQFFPIGSGPGTFQAVFFAFQPPELLNFVNHAHNDYLELLFETGLISIGVLLLFIALYIQGWLRLRHQHWNRFRFIQTAAGISLLLLILHGVVDFNFHTPANAIFFAFLGGVFLHHNHKKSPR
jgi:O-antigen ligase